MGKIVRQLGIKPQLLPGDGVDKTQRFGVQTLPVQAGDAVVGAVHRVPCHRVVGTSGSLTGYAGGIEKKVRLLQLEHVDMSRFFVPTKGTAI